MSVLIHPTAIIDPKAELDENVEVGPYSIIEKNVKISKGTKVGPQVLLKEWITIGKDCTIGKGVIIGTLPQDVNFNGKKSFVKIGDRNLIREYVTIHRGTKEESITQIGNDNFLMAYVHVAHNCKIEDKVIIANVGNLAGYVTVEKNAMIGGLVGVHQYVRIGAYSIIGGCSKVTKDVPPYVRADGHPSIVKGLNSVGLRRAHFSPETRSILKKAYKILFKSGLNTTQALKKIDDGLELIPEIKHLCEFIKNSQRGICKS
ncbi:acyl-ACP--UDP-N-acetylglucosamine O-acyltransferase [Candidatus Aerophobetes bacterium]|nr:acyl-ACP--UDP-N-acetylglucosamine O-acyltransferase [Candidatus Aerophobetes bacterium]